MLTPASIWAQILAMLPLLVIKSLCQANSPNAQPSSSIYVVQFLKLPPHQLQAINPNSTVLSQTQFLESLIRNTPRVLSQGTFYVNYTSQSPSLNFSNLQKIDNITNPSARSLPISEQPPKFPNLGEKGSLGEGKYTNVTMNINSMAIRGVVVPLLGAQAISKTSIPTDVLAETPQNSSNLIQIGRLPTNSLVTPYKNIKNASSKVVGLKNKIRANSSNINNKNFSTEFVGVGLFQQLPTKFVINQVYKISGTIADGKFSLPANESTYYIFIVFGQTQTQKQFRCGVKLKIGQVDFEMGCKMRRAGLFNVSIVVGNSGPSWGTAARQVVEYPTFIVNRSVPINPAGLSLQISDTELYVNWQSTAPLTKITFTQTSITLEYIASNFHNRFLVPHGEFINFDEIQTTITISHADSLDGTLFGISSLFGNMLMTKFQAAQHLNSLSHQSMYNLVPALPQQTLPNETIAFQANFSLNVLNEAYTINSYQQLTKIYFDDRLKMLSSSIGKGIVRARGSAKLSFKLPTEGAYILEINEDTGVAVISQPIYVGSAYPLLPDYLDLKLQSLMDKSDLVLVYEQYLKSLYPRQDLKQPSLQSSLDEKVGFLLKLLNLFRKKQIVYPLLLDRKISQLATSHSNDMATKSYFSHINPSGDGPKERAREVGIRCAVGENIARSRTLIEAHLSFLRSGLHLDNSVNKLWTRVGIGIKQDPQGFYLITQFFSARDITRQPLTPMELQIHKNQIVQAVKQKYPSIKTQNKQASSLIQEWADSDRSIPIIQYLVDKGIKQLMTYSTFRFNYYAQFVGDLDKSLNLARFDSFQQIGVNLGASRIDSSMMECYIVFVSVRA